MLKVYQVTTAPPVMATWVRRALEPAIAAARFQLAPPIEFRPTGRWGGWSSPRDMARDGRVAVWSHVRLFSSPEALADVYIHEATHSVLHQVDTADELGAHDCAFFSISYALRRRIDTSVYNDQPTLVARLSLYDLSSLPDELTAEPDEGLCRSIAWSIEQAKELAPTSLSAEQLAVEIVSRFYAWRNELQDRPRRDRLLRRQELAEVARLKRLKDKLFVSNMVASVSTVFLVLIAVMLWSR